MRYHRYSRHAARTFLALVLLLGIPLAIGQAVQPGRGAGIGAGLGVLLFSSYVGGHLWRHRRGLAWVQAGRELGLRALYHRDSSDVPVPGFDLLGNLLEATIDGRRLVIGDRMEQFLVEHTSGSIGTVETYRTEVSNPIANETFVALWIPGLGEERFSVGKRSSLQGGDPIIFPTGNCGEALRNWLHAHPAWRVEGMGDVVAAWRPYHLAPTGSIGQWVEVGRSLGAALAAAVH